MAAKTSIEWTRGADGTPGATWNPITGCSVVSPGCTNCYAMGLAGTRLRNHPSRAGLTVDSKAGPVWNGEVRLNEEWLTQPLQWRRPRTIFVCAHGDLFHESVPDAWIDRVFAVMALAPQHTFQVLTKRSARMQAYITATALQGGVEDRVWRAQFEILPASGHKFFAWPPANVWLGVSAEDQTRADERVPDLLATPAAVRFVSAEPLLGPIDFHKIPMPGEADGYRASALYGHEISDAVGGCLDWVPPLDWLIVGGESGPKARPMRPMWARSIRDQCAAAGVAFYFKQWGAFAPEGSSSQRWLWRPDGSCRPDPLPEGISRHAKEGFSVSYRVGKKAAGRLLDGVEHNGMPEAIRP